MIDIQIQECDLIEVVESIINKKVEVDNQDTCGYLMTEIVNELESYDSEETQVNNLLGLNSALHHEVKASNHSKKITLLTNEEALSSNDNNVDVRSSNQTKRLAALYDITFLQILHNKKYFLTSENALISFGGTLIYVELEK